MALVLTGCSASETTPSPHPAPEPRRSARVLFIGNSHTYYHDLPGTIAQMGAAHGIEISTRQEAPGGFKLDGHAERDETAAAIRHGGWDFVVLQESGGAAGLSASEAENVVYPAARSLADLARAHNPDARIVLYLTHGYRRGAYWRSEPEMQTFEGHQARIAGHYRTMARDIGGEIAPAGLVWRELFAEDPELRLHDADDIHPSPLGSFVSAAVLFRTMFDQPVPTTLPRPGRSLDAAAHLATRVNAIDLDALSDSYRR